MRQTKLLSSPWHLTGNSLDIGWHACSEGLYIPLEANSMDFLGFSASWGSGAEGQVSHLQGKWET
jgi:hypothetical protein